MDNVDTEQKNSVVKSKVFLLWFIFIVFVILSGMWIARQWGTEVAMKYFAGHSVFIIFWILKSSSTKKDDTE